MNKWLGFVLLLPLGISGSVVGQNVGINTSGSPGHPSSILDVDAADKGVLLPRISINDASSAAPISSPATGLMVYNTNASVTGGSGEGLYYWTGSVWAKLVSDRGSEFIINQNTNDQTGSFRVSGSGRMNTSVQSPLYTRADAGTISIRPNTDSQTAIQLQNASGQPILNVDASTGRVGINTSSPGVALDVRTNDAIKLPGGSTAQRPATPLEGSLRFNADSKTLEYFNGTQWVSTDQTPVGSIIAFGGTVPPAGWLLCNGATVSRSTYADLYSAIGTAWGNGDGSSTFHLPDLRGRFLRGVDGGTGRDPDAGTRTASNTGGNTGNAVGSVQGDAVSAHTHTVSGNTAGSGNLSTSAVGDHVHSVDPPNTGTSFNGDHQHTLKAPVHDANNSSSQGWPANDVHNALRTSDRGRDRNVHVDAVAVAGNHSHTLDIGAFNSGLAGGHAHTLADHAHSINLSSGNPTGATSAESRPKNANVVYIIKASK